MSVTNLLTHALATGTYLRRPYSKMLPYQMASTLATATKAAMKRPPLHPTIQDVAVMTIAEAHCDMAAFDRRDLFKVLLVTEGANELHYATRSYHIDRPALVFTNKLVPYSWEPVESSGEQQGFLCAFTEDFLHSAMRGVSLLESVLYRVDGNPVYFLDEAQLRYLTDTFLRMRQEYDTDYPHKYDLLRNQLSITIHEATRMQPASSQHIAPINAAERVTTLFLTLLDVQFPVTTQIRQPILKNAQEYADRLAVHVNSLNRSVKEITGKSTTTHIAERLVGEAKVLLHHTDWSVGDIAESLGFEYATYFTNFFKKHAGTTPLAFRNAG
ncbi:MAG: AraC family transcriptional regulator [Hymenobacter sp.]|nr:MAG: AraC family transcriptional regulator [Hymenobacter sp.]